MIFNDAIKRRLELGQTYQDILLGRSWKVAAYDLSGNLMGTSDPFKYVFDGNIFELKAPLHITILITGKLSYVTFIEDQKEVSTLIREYSALIKAMKNKRKTRKQILLAIGEYESKGFEITIQAGVKGKELNVASVHLILGSTFTIDTFRFH